MPDTKKPNPYATPASINETGNDSKSASVFWTVPGGSVGTVIGACLIRPPDEIFRDHSVIAMLVMLGMWGFIGLLGSMVWRLPRRWLWGPVRAPRIARFTSGVLLLVTTLSALQMGRTHRIDLPEPAMSITMIGLLVTCVVGCVEFEAWYGRRMG